MFLLTAVVILSPGLVFSEALLFECNSALAGFDFSVYNNIVHVDKSAATTTDNNGTTREKAYREIQEAIDDANDFDVIFRHWYSYSI